MLALLGSVLGLLAALAPRLIGYFENKQNHKHELELIDKHADVEAKLFKIRQDGKMQELGLKADMSAEMAAFAAQLRPTGVAWVDAFNALVRPLMALAFFGLYAAVKVAMFLTLQADHPMWTGTIMAIWNEEDWAIFASVVTFYFGNRTFNNVRNGK